MAQLPVIDMTYRVALRWSLGQTHAVNVLHFRKMGALPGAGPDELADRLFDSAVPHMWLSVASQARVTHFDITPLDGEAATRTYAIPDAHVPLWSGQPGGDYTQALAMVVSARTDRRGPSFRGRVFLPWASEQQMTAGRFEASCVNGTQNSWNLFHANLSESATDWNFMPVIASYKLAQAEDITSYVARPVPGVVRRRNNRLRG